MLIQACLYGTSPEHVHPVELDGPAATVPAAYQRLQDLHRSFDSDPLPLDTPHLLTLTTMDQDVRMRNRSMKGGRVDEKAWAKAVAGIGGKLHLAQLDGIGPTVTVSEGESRTLPKIDWKVQHRQPPEGSFDALAPVLVEWLVEVAAGPGLASGFVTVDDIADPYDDHVGGVLRRARQPFDVEVPGYYWAVVLQQAHLDALGGPARIRAEAPVAAIHEAGPSTLVCQVTERPSDLDLDRVTAWRTYLRALLGGRCRVEAAHPEYASPVWLVEQPIIPRTVGSAFGRPLDRTDWSKAAPGCDASGARPGPVTVVVPWAERPGVDEAEIWRAVVDAWAWVGAGRGLGAIDGVFAGAGDPVLTTDGITVQVDLGPCDPAAALQVLAHTLGNTARDLGTPGNERFGTISLR